jgi:hypothetical protein
MDGRGGVVFVVPGGDAVWDCAFSRMAATVRVKASVRAWQSHRTQAVLKLVIEVQMHIKR